MLAMLAMLHGRCLRCFIGDACDASLAMVLGTTMQVRFGEGFASSASMALLMMRSFSMAGKAAKNLQSVTRHLYARCLKDGESAVMVQDTVGKHWSTDRHQNLPDRLDEFVQAHVCPGIVEGIYPKNGFRAPSKTRLSEALAEACL